MIPRRNTAKVAVHKLSPGAREQSDDVVAAEEPLEIRLTITAGGKKIDKPLSVTMRTPGDDFELAAGFLYSEGIIRASGDIHEISYCTGKSKQEYNIVNVRLRPSANVDLERLARNFYMTSSCGVCGKTSIDAVQTQCSAPLPESGFEIKRALLFQLPEKLRAKQAVFEKTGGLHAAALFNAAGELLDLREDVGRHNAVDKLIGEQVLKGKVPLHDRALLVSGRTSFELVQKAVMAGVPLLAAVGAPSSLAVELATRFGMTLAGFLRGDRCNIYSAPQRVV